MTEHEHETETERTTETETETETERETPAGEPDEPAEPLGGPQSEPPGERAVDVDAEEPGDEGGEKGREGA